MPEQVRRLPKSNTGKRGSKYDVLLDGEPWLFRWDEDFRPGTTKQSARQAIYQWANKRRVRVTVRTSDARGIVAQVIE